MAKQANSAPLSRRLREFWLRKRMAILRGTLIGVAVHVFLIFYPIRLTEWMELAGVDWIMRAQSQGWSAIPGDPAFVFLDIDDATLEKWPSVPYTPRDKLLKLIQFAVNGQAAALVVDVNLSDPINPAGTRREMAPADVSLADFLGRYSRQKSCDPMIILDRRMQRTPEGCWRPRPSFLDPYIDESTGAVEWGTVQFNLDPDSEIRFWRLWEQTCDVRRALYPSVEWLAIWRLRHLRDSPPRCLPEPGGFDVPHSHGLSERIVYRIPWKLASENERPQVAGPSGTVPVLTTIPAFRITEAENGHDVSGELVRDRVVMIGGSYEDARDLHATPIGEMPGALVIANSIFSLNRPSALNRIPLWAEFGLSVLLIGLASALFATLQHLWAYLLAAILTITAVLPLSVMSFRNGYWLDFVIPLLAVQAHHLIAQFEQALEHRAGRNEAHS